VTGRRTPTREELEAARGIRVPDVIAEDLEVLFCGINPGLYSAAVGHHFARPGNRFWTVLHLSGFTERRLPPSEDRSLVERGLGIVNIVDRPTGSADELTPAELAEGGVRLVAKVERYRPAVLAVLGLSAYREAFRRPHTVAGAQVETVGRARLWVLPNPSGLNASYQLAALVGLFQTLRRSLREDQPSRGRAARK